MPKVLTDGKMKIGAYMFSDRKRPALCIEKGSSIMVYAYFRNIDEAEMFIDELGKMVNAKFEDD